MMTMLHMARDELLPMVLSAQTPQVKLNIYIEERFDAIIVAGRNDFRNAELGFAITHAAIVDGVYRASIVPSLRKLVYLLENLDGNAHISNQDPGLWHTH